MTELKPILVKMTDEEIDAIVDKATEALERGDDEAFNTFMKQVPIDPGQADILKHYDGIEHLIEYGFNLSEAVETYGEEWLYN